MDSLQQLSSDVTAIESLASRGTLDVDSWNKLESLASKLAKRASCGKDALIISGLYLDRLSLMLTCERASVRKHYIHIVGSCLEQSHRISKSDSLALVKLLQVLLNNRSAICRLQAITSLVAAAKPGNHHGTELTEVISEALASTLCDKSKLVRLKAVSLSKKFLSFHTRGDHVGKLKPLMDALFRLISVRPESGLTCLETWEGVGEVLCLSPFPRQMVYEELSNLFNVGLSRPSRPVASRVIHCYLNDYERWAEFSVKCSETSLATVKDFLRDEASRNHAIIKTYRKIVDQAFSCISQSESLSKGCTAPFRIIWLFAQTCTEHKGSSTYDSVMVKHLQRAVQLFLKTSQEEQQTSRHMVSWCLKAFAAALQSGHCTGVELQQIFVKDFSQLSQTFLEETMNCVFSLQNSVQISQRLLQTFMEHHGLWQEEQNVKVSVTFLDLIGHLSQRYKVASDIFMKRLRTTRGESKNAEFDYLQHEDLKVQEEDAAQHFSQLLLDGNSMPGCYIPMLVSLASEIDVPLAVRLAALRSLSSFLLLSIDLAKRHRTLITRLLEDEEKPVKVAALATVAKLILTSPNEFPDFLDGVNSLMDSDISDAQLEAYSVYAHLLLSKTMKAQGFMKRLAVGLLHKDTRIKGLMKELVTQLMDGNAKSRCVLVLTPEAGTE
ncbi:unnamed protein product [Closterium sp. NIES-54]